MTREEIRERALTLAVEVNGLPTLHSAPVVESALVALVRATLEEAARAVCVGCNLYHPSSSFIHPEFGRMHDASNSWCTAGPIPDLIAALDGK